VDRGKGAREKFGKSGGLRGGFGWNPDRHGEPVQRTRRVEIEGVNRDLGKSLWAQEGGSSEESRSQESRDDEEGEERPEEKGLHRAQFIRNP
jgi:hypothetical protein